MGDEAIDVGAQRPAEDRALSLLGRIQARRDEILAGEHLDLAVPRWTDPEIIVRYHPVDHRVIRRAQGAIEKAPKDRRAAVEVDANADILINGCSAVLARLDGKDYSLRLNDPGGEPTTFDADLAANLGLDSGATARAVVRALFITEGDMFSAAVKLGQWSGYVEAEADEAVEGE